MGILSDEEKKTLLEFKREPIGYEVIWTKTIKAAYRKTRMIQVSTVVEKKHVADIVAKDLERCSDVSGVRIVALYS